MVAPRMCPTGDDTRHPLPLSCVCESCARVFREATGLELPTAVDWDDETFRRWVVWRYDCFSAYIARLAGEIRAEYPDAAVVINHYHRPRIPSRCCLNDEQNEAGDTAEGPQAVGDRMGDLLTARKAIVFQNSPQRASPGLTVA